MSQRSIEIRNSIIEHIKENGPVKEYKLYDILDYPWTTIRYNVRMMREKDRTLTKEHVNGELMIASKPDLSALISSAFGISTGPAGP